MVSQRRLKRPVTAFVAIVFITSLLITTLFEMYSTVSANTPVKPVILEVTDLIKANDNTTSVTSSNPSQLNLGTNYTVHTMTVKQLNASREELLGKYDAVVFAPSRVTNLNNAKKYSPEKVVYDFTLEKGTDKNKDDVTPITNFTSKAHNTSLFENDITLLKQSELNQLMENGVPVFFHTDVFTTVGEKAQGVKRNFDMFASEQQMIFSNVSEGKSKINQTFSQLNINRITTVKVLQNQKVLSSNVSANKVVSENFATSEKPITFEYELAHNPSSDAYVELYIDFDSNDRFTSQELIERKQADISGQFTYSIDVPSYTSPRYWKIVVHDPVNRSISYQTGRFLLKDVQAKANVLQVVTQTDGNGTKVGSLTDAFKESNMLKAEGLYDFKVDVIDFKQFNENTCEKIDSEYRDWLFKYDLIIFGFKDSYISGLDVTCSEPALSTFMNEGRGVMFTHDMLYRIEKNRKFSNDPKDRASWETFYADRFAVNQFTNMGIYAQNRTTKVQQVSKGLFTEYPYKLAEKPSSSNEKMIEETHNQYFGLDLENPSLTPWYNLIGNRTIGDSAHHYYMYTVDNLTYSGAGHTNTFTTRIEKEIFVNTMFRAFIGSNHAPKIELQQPVLDTNRKSSVYDIEPLYLSWKSIDYDFADQFLDTRVLVNGKQVFPSVEGEFASVRNNEVQGFFYNHQASPGETLKIEIETKEQREKGAITSKEKFNVDVLASDEAALVSRTIEPLTSAVGDGVTLKYDVNYLVPIIQKPSGNAYKDFSWTINVKETIPSGYSIEGNLPAGWERGKNSNELIGTLQATCIIQNGDKSCKASSQSYEVKLKANKIGDYTFNTGKYDYLFEADHNSKGSDKHNVTKEGNRDLTSINTRVIEKEIEQLRLEGPINLTIGESRQLIPVLTPETTRKLDLKWHIGSQVAELTPSYVNNSATLKGLKPGKTKVYVEYTSLTGKTIRSNEVDVVVDDPPRQLNANSLDLLVGEDGTIVPTIMTTNELYRNFEFEVVSGDRVITVENKTNRELKVKGNSPGTARIKISLSNQPDYVKVAPIYVNINVTLPQLSISPSELTLWVYKDSSGKMNRESNAVTINQTGTTKLPITWTIPTNATEILLQNPTLNGATVQAVHGTGVENRTIPVTGAFTSFDAQRVLTNVNVREYPQDLLVSNVELYLENSPYTYVPIFLPSTANVRGYGMQVAEGKDVVEVIDQTKLRLKKPGIARVRIATEDVSRFFSGQDGPQIIYREFYVRVREGNDPNPELPNETGDYY